MTQTNVIQKARVTQNLPANYDEELAAEQLAIKARIGAPSGDMIRVNKDKTFTLPSGDTAPVLSVVVVGFTTLNQYYEGDYDSKNIVPPVCVAIGQEIATLRPFPDAPKPQDNGGGCHSCWANQWGSKRKGKACGNHRMLALLAPKMQSDGPLMLLKTSPTASRFWDSYVTQVTNTAGHLIKVVTEISFDQNEEYATQRFKIAGINENWHDAFPRRGPALERLLTKPDFSPAEVAQKPKS